MDQIYCPWLHDYCQVEYPYHPQLAITLFLQGGWRYNSKQGQKAFIIMTSRSEKLKPLGVGNFTTILIVYFIITLMIPVSLSRSILLEGRYRCFCYPLHHHFVSWIIDLIDEIVSRLFSTLLLHSPLPSIKVKLVLKVNLIIALSSFFLICLIFHFNRRHFLVSHHLLNELNMVKLIQRCFYLWLYA